MTAATQTKDPTTVELEGDRVVVIKRTFRAPPRLVYEAWTNPELVARWWAPACHQVTMKSCDADVRVGGDYRYVLQHGENVFSFYGTYRELTPPDRLVYTQIYEPYPDAETVITVTFEATDDGRTNMISREVYASAEARTGALESGMETGMRATMNQLDELVAELAKA
ncbi:MAG: SRPBCC family protein [Deltaproteobacteria bacterium]|jgi:uncharacterized protein YndB with AHSA1/START domain